MVYPKSNLPLVSVITVVYNGAGQIEKTIQSIVNQTYNNVEYIIIDGDSNDRTLEIIKKYDKRISCWISEPDKGIYDAMNKGIAKANGKYVWFINAGDEIYAQDTLEKIFKHCPLTADIYYGETALMNEENEILGLRSVITTRKLPKNLILLDMKKGMVVCHQSFLINKKIIPYYNLKYKHASDIDWMIACIKKSKQIINTGFILSKFLMGGHSNKYKFQSWIERFSIFKNHFGILSAIRSHCFFIIRALLFTTQGKNKVPE